MADFEDYLVGGKLFEVVLKNSDGYTNITDKVASCRIVKEAERAVDKADLIVSRSLNDSISIGNEVVIFNSNGNRIFGGTVEEKKVEYGVSIAVKSFGNELNNIYVEEVYENQSPEEIVQDLIANNTNLTYSSTATSGMTLKKWIVRGMLSSEIGKLAKLLDWQIRTDAYKKFYFEPEGYTDSGLTLEVGNNIGKIKWQDITDKIVNWIVLKGGETRLRTKETFSVSGTEYVLTYKPIEVKVDVDGTEKKGGSYGESGIDYYVLPEDKKIVFTSTPTGSNVNVEYTFFKPIQIEVKDDDSITKYGMRKKPIEARWIRSYSDARKHAKAYISKFSAPLKVGKIVLPYKYEIEDGNKVRIKDSNSGIDDEFVVKKIVLDLKKGRMELEVGSIEYSILDWQAEVQRRIKELEKAVSSVPDIVQKYLYFPQSLGQNLKVKRITIKYRNIGNSFIWGHPTNGIWGGQVNGEYLKWGWQGDATWTTHYEYAG